MNSNSFRALVLVVLTITLSLPSLSAKDKEFQPIPAQITNRAVMMQLPQGVRRVRLCTRNADGTWKPHTIAHLKGHEGHLKLRLPDGVAEQDCQVAVSWSDPFPNHAYQGPSKHLGEENSNRFTISILQENLVPMTLDSIPMERDVTGASMDPLATAAVATGTSVQSEPIVEESDIWKWRDRTLYFFNQYRGLQAIDVTDPSAPSLLATHPVNSYGEQLYLHPEADLVILLARDKSSNQRRVDLIAHESPNVLRTQASFPLQGNIIESRLVGKILYVVSRSSWEEELTDEDGIYHLTHKRGLALNKFDLSDPTRPIASEPIYLGETTRWNFWNAKVQASSTAILLTTEKYDPESRRTISTVHVVDISDPSLEPKVTHHYPTAGRVLNKFNMHLKGDILTVVTQVRQGRRYASVETFDLTIPDRPIDSVTFAANETITATRFVDDLLYVVTFLRIDPLFVIDLKDPENLRILSELEIPGFSTYLTPLNDDALISVGVEERRIAVSWFDVSDPTDTSLASRVSIGGENDRSWSEANWDEKAFGFYPNDDLILVPYQGSVPGQRSVSGVQLIDLGDGQLIKRGAFEHPFQARRARVVGDAVISISDRTLRTLDISDRDHPRLLSELTLAWPAEILHRFEDTLVQIERGSENASSTLPKLHLTSASEPDNLCQSLDLPAGYVGGSLRHNDCLYLAQTELRREENGSNKTYFTTTVIDLSDPNQPMVAGRTSNLALTQGYYGSKTEYQGAILPDGTLLWYQTNSNHHWYWGCDLWRPLDIGGRFTIGNAAFLGGDLFWNILPSQKKVHTVNVSNKFNPIILATAELSTGDNAWAEGAIRLAGSTLFHGVKRTESIEDEDGTLRWGNHHYLKSLDLGNPAQPVPGELVSLPGIFEHAAVTTTGGFLVFSSQRNYQDGSTTLSYQSLAYDGLNAFLLNELVDSEQVWASRKLFEESTLVQTHKAGGQLSIFGWHDHGQFQSPQTFPHSDYISEMKLDQDLLILKGRHLTFIDFARPAADNHSSITFPTNNFWKSLSMIEIHERSYAYLPLGFEGVRPLDFEGVFNPVTSPNLLNLKNPNEDWQIIALDSLPVTEANRALMGEALSETANWYFCDHACFDFSDWVHNAFPLARGDPIPAFEGDYDGDGKSNGWEFLTGSDPNNPQSSITPNVGIKIGNDGRRYLTSSITLSPSVRSLTKMTPEVSFDLQNWTSNPSVIEILDDPSSLSPGLTVRILSPVAQDRTAYLRWVVTSGN